MEAHKKHVPLALERGEVVQLDFRKEGVAHQGFRGEAARQDSGASVLVAWPMHCHFKEDCLIPPLTTNPTAGNPTMNSLLPHTKEAPTMISLLQFIVK